MKNLTILFALGLILFTSCSKDDSLEQTELQTIDSVYVLNQFAGSAAWESMLIDQSQNSANLAYSINNGIDAHTDGYYAPTSRDAMTIVWSGTQNGSGARRGSATIKQSTPNFSFHLDLEQNVSQWMGTKLYMEVQLLKLELLLETHLQLESGGDFILK